MSGSYFLGSNIVYPSNSLGGSNTGGGNITGILQTGASPVIGLCTVSLTSSSSFKVQYVDFTNTVHMATGTVGSLFTGIGLSFTVNNAGAAFVSGDGFLIYLSELGQNITLNARQITGIFVNVQQFQTSTTEPLDWGAAINAMFVYCGANPGVVGIIPPGFYRCDDVPVAMSPTQLVVQSNMTIYAYGAIIGSTKTTSGNYGFLGVATPSSTPSVSNVTILGGTWGGIGRNGVLSTDDNAEPYDGTRTGTVISLYVNNLTLRDVTVRGFAGNLAYALAGNNMILDNCSFWNSNLMTGAGGIRVLYGDNIRITNSQGRSGDDALQFAPIADSSAMFFGGDITNAYYIGGNVTSYAARAMVATIADSRHADSIVTSNIKGVGFIGIVGKVTSNSSLVCQIANHNSTGQISDVTLAHCQLTMDTNPSTSTLNTVLIDGGGEISTTGTYTGGVDTVVLSDVDINSPQQTAVAIHGYYSSPPASTTTLTAFTTNVHLIDCNLSYPRQSTAMTNYPTVYVQQCSGFRLVRCDLYASYSNALQLGASGVNFVASNGVIEGCRFFTQHPTSSVVPAVLVTRGDLNAIQGWSSFYLGTVPDYTVVSGVGQAVSIASTATNTYLDQLDLRGLGNSTSTISDSGTNTVVGSNVLTQAINSPTILAPIDANIPAYTKASVNLMGTYSWPQGATLLELTNTTVGTGLTINLPTAQRDGEIRILAAASATFPATSLSLSGAPVTGLGTNIVTAQVALRMVCDSGSSHWLRV